MGSARQGSSGRVGWIGSASGEARDRAARLEGADSRLLTTIAIVRATAADNDDYISYIEPFATDRMREWPQGESVSPDMLSRALRDEFEFPTMPIHVCEVLIRRAEAREYLVNVDRKVYPNPRRLNEMVSLAEKRSAMEAETAALAMAVVSYAKRVRSLDWTEARAYAALEALCEDYGAELALARREGLARDAAGDGAALSVVYGFARRALERDPATFESLVALVQGTMLANAVYFEDTRATVNRLPNLRVYLDTRPLLRALGAADEVVCEATQEMLALMREFKIRMHVFPHVLHEMATVLERVAVALRRGRPGFREQAKVSSFNREAIDALTRRGWDAGEVEALIATLPQRLADLGVMEQETPSQLERGHINEEMFDEILERTVGYKTKQPKDTDLRSLAAIDRLRGGTRPRDLSHARALFVTTNGPLVSAARQFFREEGRDAGVAHAMLDVALTAQLWVRSSHRKPDLPRRILIADCYAALSPTPELWERWVGTIGRLRDVGELSDEQVQTLIYHQQAKLILFERTHGDPGAVRDRTVADVLEGLEGEIRRPIEEGAAVERARALAADAERDRAVDEVNELRQWMDRLIGRARCITGYGGIILITCAAVVLVFAGAVHGKVGWATAMVLWVLLTAGVWAWMVRRPVRATMVQGLVAAGSITALWFAVWAVVPR